MDNELLAQEQMDVSMTPTAVESSGSLLSYQEFAPAVKQIADLMDELRTKAPSRNSYHSPMCFKASSTPNSVEEVCYSTYCFRYDKSGIGHDEWCNSLELLRRRLKAVFLPPPPPQVPSLMYEGGESTVPWAGLFNGLSFILGFFNFIPSYEDRPSLEDRRGGMNDHLACFCVDTFGRLHGSATLSDGDWKQLREAAAIRVWLRLHTKLWYRDYYEWDPSTAGEKLQYRRSFDYFSYRNGYRDEDLYKWAASPLVNKIVAGEEKRLATFLAALHGTLQVLSAVATLYEDQPPPDDMIDFLYKIYSILSGAALDTESVWVTRRKEIEELQEKEAEARRLLEESQQLITDLKEKLQAELASNRDLQSKLQTIQQQAESDIHSTQEQYEAEKQSLTAEVRTKQTELERLKSETAFVRKGALKEEMDAPFWAFMEQMRDLTKDSRGGKERSIKDFPVKSGYVDTLFYSYRPEQVAYALARLGEIKRNIEGSEDPQAMRKRKILPVDILSGFAEVLGYTNLYHYLIQLPFSDADRRFLQVVNDLSYPPSHVNALASHLNAVSWLADERNYPPIGEMPVSVCSFTIRSDDTNPGNEGYTKAIAQTIITSEIRRLLDFRMNLFVHFSAFAPLTQEEEEQLAQAQGGILTPLGLTVQIKDSVHDKDFEIEATHSKGFHRYIITIDDPRNLRKPIVDVVLEVDNEANYIDTLDEEEKEK